MPSRNSAEAPPHRWLNGLAASWGAAEATLFFIVPDVLLSRMALQDRRRALQACLWALAGALAGGTLVWMLGYADPAANPMVRTIGGPGVRLLPAGSVGDLPSLETEDGVRLGGWFIPARGSSGGAAVLVFNGNAGDRSFRSPLATVLSRAGLSVMLFDYRGYGGNPGSPSEAGLIADARAARACTTFPTSPPCRPWCPNSSRTASWSSLS